MLMELSLLATAALEVLLFLVILAAPGLAAWSTVHLARAIRAWHRERQRRAELEREAERRRAYARDLFRQIQSGA